MGDQDLRGDGRVLAGGLGGQAVAYEPVEDAVHPQAADAEEVRAGIRLVLHPHRRHFGDGAQRGVPARRFADEFGQMGRQIAGAGRTEQSYGHDVR
jgi:hypothetical protein